jgi:hypothetical protein
VASPMVTTRSAASDVGLANPNPTTAFCMEVAPFLLRELTNWALPSWHRGLTLLIVVASLLLGLALGGMSSRRLGAFSRNLAALPPLQSTMLEEPPRGHVCAPCKYAVTNANARVAVTLNSTAGYGRTGNVLISLRHAARRAHECKLALILPDEDASSHVFLAEAHTRQLNFSSRPGPVHPACGDPGIGAGLSANVRTFFEMKPLPHGSTPAHARFSTEYAFQDTRGFAPLVVLIMNGS